MLRFATSKPLVLKQSSATVATVYDYLQKNSRAVQPEGTGRMKAMGSPTKGFRYTPHRVIYAKQGWHLVDGVVYNVTRYACCVHRVWRLLLFYLSHS